MPERISGDKRREKIETIKEEEEKEKEKKKKRNQVKEKEEKCDVCQCSSLLSASL